MSELFRSLVVAVEEDTVGDDQPSRLPTRFNARLILGLSMAESHSQKFEPTAAPVHLPVWLESVSKDIDLRALVESTLVPLWNLDQ